MTELTQKEEHDRGEGTSPEQAKLTGLDVLNLVLADVQGGVGPFLAVYLTASRNWPPADVGIAISAGSFATVAAQTPMGALVDVLRRKRSLIALASLLIAIGSVVIVVKTGSYTVIGAQIALGVTEAIIPPTIAGISLGLAGSRLLDRRMGRNQSFNHVGNVGVAALAGLLGSLVGDQWIFYLVAIMGAASIVSVYGIRAAEIDYDMARGATETKDDGDRPQVSGFKTLLTDRRLLVFAVAVVLFHFGNAAMLPLVGQKLTEETGGNTGAFFTSAAIIVAQAVMIFTAWWSGRTAGTWGRKPVFLVGFIALPIRGLLFMLSNDPVYLLSVQVLDGVGAGIFGVVSVIMIADLTIGTGRFNVTQGAIATAIGIGASLSTLLGEFVVGAAGYDAAFLTLAGIAGIALAVFWLFVPETKELAQTRAEPEAAEA